MFEPYNAVVNAYYLNALSCMERIETVIGNSDKAAHYRQMRKKVLAAFQEIFFDKSAGCCPH